MALSRPIEEIVSERVSCRKYRKKPIAQATKTELTTRMAEYREGPFGTPLRFTLIAADDESRQTLKSLGTYGSIRDPMGFVVGAMGTGRKNLEDCGYAMERIVLDAADLGLGTCWLGGSFTKGSFSRKMGLAPDERIPAVLSIGYDETPEGDEKPPVGTRRTSRLAWEELFFDANFDAPLSQEAALSFAPALQLVRIGPSASNKQPWRFLRSGKDWNLYIRRTPGYRDSLLMRLLKVDDMQRLDAGIAMSHFELALAASGVSGRWIERDPGIDLPDDLTEYVATWISS